MDFIISGPQIYTEQEILPHAAIAIEKGVIKAIDKTPANTVNTKIISFPENYHVVAGFIDLHIHGVNNQDVMDATPEALSLMSQALAAEGTTAFLATTMTASQSEIENALMAVRKYIDMQKTIEGAIILGVHLEGPFISPKKIGAQRLDQLLMPDITLIEHWQKITKNIIKIVTLAPELPNSADFIRYLQQHNIIASIGHSDATYAETQSAIDAGIHYATHVFNAMRGIHQREPGAVLAALLSDQVATELIVDGKHLHSAIVELILKLKNKEKMILITDAMRAKCLGDGTYDLGGQAVTVKHGVATLADGTLAGSTLTLPSAIRNMMHFTNCSLFDAAKMASENPAKALGIFHKKGSIAVGKDADLVVLDEQYQVVMTVCGGVIVYSEDGFREG